MNKQNITFKAGEQELIKTGGINSYASNIVAYIEATFELGENWTGYDSVRAVWSNDYLTDISTVLDPNGRCIVPTEVLTDTGNVTVNLVGSISVDDELTDRLTTYPCKALTVDEDAKVEGDETESITPSQFEQFVSIVHDEVEEVTGMSAEASTLPAGSDATASYSDGVLSLGIPRGADGADGKDGADGVTPDIDIGTVETLETGVPAYANITGTVENPSLNLGLPKGNTGDTGATGAPAGFGAVTATIDGTTGTPSVDVTASGADTAKNFAFAFHNLKGEQGEQGEQGDPGVVQDVTVNGTSVVDQNGVAVIQIPELVKTVQGNPIVLDDAFGEVKNLTVELSPIQEGSGTPSPQNVRPITGHDSVTVTDTDGDSHSQSKTVTLPHTVYGAGVGVTSGEGTETHGRMVLNGTETYTLTSAGTFRVLVATMASGRWYSDAGAKCDSYEKAELTSAMTNGQVVFGSGNSYVYFDDDRASTVAEFQALLAQNNVTITYPLATPTDLSTTPTDITLYNGDNVISSDGDMELNYVQDMAIVIEKLENLL